MRSILTKLTVAAAVVTISGVSSCAFAQDAKAGTKPTYTEPPEMTTVTGRLIHSDEAPVKGGIAYFIFQSRLNEIPHTDSLAKVKAISEKAVAIDEGGSFSLTMAPGNYTMVFDPAADSSSVPEPGAESMTVARKMTKEQVQGRIAAIKENAQKGLPVVDGKLGEAFVVENRAIRPPLVEYGDVALGSDDSVLVRANDESGKPIDFPAVLKLRGKNGDIYEAHSPSISAPGQYAFFDVFPQPYTVFAIGTRPKPGTGDDITTPSVKNNSLVFDGSPIEHVVTVVPGKPGGEKDAPPPPPPPAKKE